MTRLLPLLILIATLAAATPLDDYVRAEDPTYSWSEVAQLPGKGYTARVLELTSQSWVTL